MRSKQTEENMFTTLVFEGDSKISQPLKVHVLLRMCVIVTLFSWKAVGRRYPTFQISDSNSVFQNQFLDTSDGSLYIGGLNFIYKFDSTLGLLKTAETGPVDDNSDCRPPPVDCTSAKVPTDNHNKAILLHEQRVITCGSVYHGTCRIRDPDTLRVTFDDSIREVVPNTASGLAVAFVGIGDNDKVLYVASSYGDWFRAVPTVSTRLVSQSTPENELFELTSRNAHITIPITTITESPAGQMFNISYIYGFTSGLFSYFAGSQPRIHDTISRYTSKLVRLCNNDPNFRSYIELALVCGSGDDNDYNLIQSAYLASLSLDGDESKDMLVASFSKSDTLTSSVPSAESVICVYDVEDINQEFYNRRLDCAQQGTDNTEIRWAESTLCRDNTFLANSIRSSSPAEYCHTTETQFPLGDDRRAFVISATPVYQTDSKITAVGAVQHFETSVIFSGDADGNVKKLRMTGATAEEYESLSLHDTPIIRNGLLPSQDRKFIFITSEDQITRIPVEECLEYTTCEECHTSRDPHCGWCSLEAKCSQRIDSECKGSLNGTSLRWLSSREDCLAITAITPEFVPEETMTKLMIRISNLPAVSLGNLTCAFYDDTVIVGSQSAIIVQNMSSVTCSSPDNIVASTQGFKTITLQLHYQEDGNGQNIASKAIDFYSCHRLSSCSKCAGNRYGCKWCLDSKQCIDSLYDCNVGIALNSSSVCPLILRSNELLIAAGTSKQLLFDGINLPKTNNFCCKISFTSLAEFSIPARVNNSQIICDEHVYEYSSSAESITGSLRVFWGNYAIDMEGALQVTIYNCSRKAVTAIAKEMNKPTCGMCLSIGDAFGCNWCRPLSDCLLTDDVSTCGENERILPSMSCPNPTITNIFPTSGHTAGGTRITIHGYNLGLIASDVRNITIASVPCESKQFVSPQMLLCTTGRNQSTRSGSVIVTFNSTTIDPTESKGTFSFVVPRIYSVEPTRGPRSGGTTLTVRGIHLDAGLNRSVAISTTTCDRGSGYFCEIIEELTDPMSVIICKTSSAANLTSGYLSVTFDHGCESGGDKFVYMEDPIVNEFERLSSTASGGLDVRIEGSSFDIIQRAHLEVRIGTATFTSNCSITTRRLTCKSPDITTLKRAYPLSLPVSNISLCMDGVTTYKPIGPTFPNSVVTQFVFFRDPVYFHIPKGGNMMQIPHGSQNGYHIKIRGENLTLASTLLDVSVTIDGEACTVLHLSIDCLTCLPPVLRPGTYEVTVLHGNLHFMVGFVEYQEFTGDNRLVVILLCALCVLVLTCVCLMPLLYCLHISKKKKKKSIQNSYFVKDSQTSASNANVDDDKMSDHTYCSQDMDYLSISSTNTDPNNDQAPHLPPRNQTSVDMQMDEISANSTTQSHGNHIVSTSTSKTDEDRFQANIPNRGGDHEEKLVKYSVRIYKSDEKAMPNTTGTQSNDGPPHKSTSEADQHQTNSPTREGDLEEEFVKYSNRIYDSDEKSTSYTTGTELTELTGRDDDEDVSPYSRDIYADNAM